MALWAACGALVAIAIDVGPLGGVAHVQDEVVYGWQAEQIANGKLHAPVPEPRASRVYDFVLDTPRGRIGIFPLGWPLVLAAGTFVGAAASVNPVLHGLTVLVAAAIARRHGGAAAGLVAAPLVALSPQMLLLGASRMSHPLAALLVLAAFGFAVDAETARQPRRAALLGGVLAAAALVRPFDALVAALVLLPVGLAGRGRSRRSLLSAGVALLAGLGAVALQNLAATGDAATFAQTRYFEATPPPVPGEGWRFAPGCNDLGFGPEKGCFATWGSFGHTPEKAWLFAERNASLAADLWLGTPWALVLLVPVLLSRGGARRAAAVVLLLLLAMVAGYALYWYGGSCYGARFWHSALPPLLVAVALGAAALLERLRWTPVIALVLVVPMVWSLVRALPELSTYWGIDDRFVRIEESWEREPALILVAYRSELRRVHHPHTAGESLLVAPHRWRAAWWPRGSERVAFVEYHPELVDATLAAHAGRVPWIYEMAADPREDRLRPLEPGDRSPRQRADLELPAPLPLRPAPRVTGELWSGSFRVVEVPSGSD